ncbi:MAG: M28 family peptidase [Gammaproteobacteria bacterium]
MQTRALRKWGSALAVLALLNLAGRAMSDTPSASVPANMASAKLVGRLQAHVGTLAREIGERNVFRPHALHAAANYLRAQWASRGYRVVSQSYDARGVHSENLEVTLPGVSRPSEIILIGAHYDSVRGSPGANDNASGVAALLELSLALVEAKLACSLRFVAFVNEEPPFFYWSDMGSRVYAKAARARGDDIRLMISLEMLGYYSDEPDSQRYPPLFGFFYPERANFIGFVSNFASRRQLKELVAAFRARSDFPAESLATFEFIPGVAWSDHRSFWREDYPAVMVTDTAFYRYRHYHSRTDTPEKLNYPAMARVVTGLQAALALLAR